MLSSWSPLRNKNLKFATKTFVSKEQGRGEPGFMTMAIDFLSVLHGDNAQRRQAMC